MTELSRGLLEFFRPSWFRLATISSRNGAAAAPSRERLAPPPLDWSSQYRMTRSRCSAATSASTSSYVL